MENSPPRNSGSHRGKFSSACIDIASRVSHFGKVRMSLLRVVSIVEVFFPPQDQRQSLILN